MAKRMYARFFKRVLDFIVSFLILILVSPILLILCVCGTIAMKGNPFFVQPRPGKIGKDGKEKIFHLIKFRSMNNKRDDQGVLLSDTLRLNKYGKFLRCTSLDELPELFNILLGQISLVGPRPLAVKYLPFYTEEERKRHSVRPGLTGLAQVNGRNSLQWEQKFMYDLEYVNNITFLNDIKILFKTVATVLKREDIGVRGSEELIDFDTYRMNQWEGIHVH